MISVIFEFAQKNYAFTNRQVIEPNR